MISDRQTAQGSKPSPSQVATWYRGSGRAKGDWACERRRITIAGVLKIDRRMLDCTNEVRILWRIGDIGKRELFMLK